MVELALVVEGVLVWDKYLNHCNIDRSNNAHS
jgi:hypothetical protein